MMALSPLFGTPDGTTVDVYLPAALTEGHFDKDSSGPSPADKKRILVTDRDEVMRDIMGIMLIFSVTPPSSPETEKKPSGFTKERLIWNIPLRR